MQDDEALVQIRHCRKTEKRIVDTEAEFLGFGDGSNVKNEEEDGI